MNDLRKTVLGQTLTALEGAVDAGEAMLYNANGLFTSIGTTFNTPNGATVTRREVPYLPVAAVQKTTDNFLSVTNHRPLLKSGQTGTGSNCAGIIATLAQSPATAVWKLPDSTKERA